MTYQHTPRRTKAPARFPNTIRERRTQAGLSQEDLARVIGKSRSMVSAWERGRVLPTLPSVFRIAVSLDTMVEHLYWDLYRPPTNRQDANT